MLKCQRCGYEWENRQEPSKIKKCPHPKCQSWAWRTPKAPVFMERTDEEKLDVIVKEKIEELKEGK